MKVAVFASYGPSLTKFRGPLLGAMVAAGHDVVASAPDCSPDTISELKSLGVRYVNVALNRRGLNPLQDLGYTYRVFRFLRSEQPDLCLFYTIKPVIFGTFAARAAGIPKIYSLITGLGYTFIVKSGVARLLSAVTSRLYSLALRLNTAAFFQNPDDRDLFVSRGLVAAKKTHLVNGSGVDLDFYSRQPFREGPPVFLMISRLLQSKGIMEYVAAAERLKAQFPQCEFLLAGGSEKGPDAIALEQLDPWFKSGLVKYLGWIDDVRPLLGNCTAYVLPSYREGTPRSVLEAMASARPVVTTDAPGCRETVIDGYNGYLVPVKDVEKLAHALQCFVREPGLARAMGANSRKLAEEKYDVIAVNREMLKTMNLSADAGTTKGKGPAIDSPK